MQLLSPPRPQFLNSTFANQAVDVNSILVMYTLNGDADLNGKIDASDYFLIDKGFLSGSSANPLGGYRNGDFDYSGKIDASDYFLIDKSFLSQPASAATAFSQATISASAAPKVSRMLAKTRRGRAAKRRHEGTHAPAGQSVHAHLQ